MSLFGGFNGGNIMDYLEQQRQRESQRIGEQIVEQQRQDDERNRINQEFQERIARENEERERQRMAEREKLTSQKTENAALIWGLVGGFILLLIIIGIVICVQQSYRAAAARERQRQAPVWQVPPGYQPQPLYASQQQFIQQSPSRSNNQLASPSKLATPKASSSKLAEPIASHSYPTQPDF